MHVRLFGTLRVRTGPGIATIGLYQEQLDGFLTKTIAAREAYVARNASFLSHALDRLIGEVALYFVVRSRSRSTIS